MSKNPPRIPASSIVGAWIVAHFRARQILVGTHVVAKQMRKQGYPLHLALAVLTQRL